MAMVIVVIGYDLIYPDSTFSEAFKASIRITWPVLGCTKESLNMRVVI